MQSEKAKQILSDAMQGTARRALGHDPTPMPLFATQAMDGNVADRSALPVLPSNTSLQTADGKDIFLIGYSVIGGPDVIG